MRIVAALVLGVPMFTVMALVVRAQSAPPLVIDVKLGSLKTVPTPEPANLNQFLNIDPTTGKVSEEARAAAIALGKAGFWDQAVGSDGVEVDAYGARKPIGQACASCHFNAGADSRTFTQLNPGFRAMPPDNFFTPPFGVNYQLRRVDFPFFRLTDPDNRFSTVLFDTNDVASSQGVSRQHFVDIVPGSATDLGSPEASIFNRATPPAREVEPRNTPTMVNAVFNFRNFWDGRARNEFNGVNPIGDLDPFARVLISPVPGTMGKTRLDGNLRLESSSLASQAVGPPLSDLEMSFNGRTFAKLGKKMLSFQHALTNQQVAPDDSVFFQQPSLNLIGQTVFQGPFPSRFPDNGIGPSYKDLIRRAFQPRWWNDPQVITFGACTGLGITSQSAGGNDPTLCFQLPSTTPLTTDQFTQMEFNFSLFFGIGVQMYEATLRADDTPFDRCFDQGGTAVAIDPTQPPVPDCSALTTQQKLGLQLFQDKAKCIACHSGPELTNASVQNVRNEKLERMIMGDNNVAVYDNGFYNTAVRRCVGLASPCDDVGLGATIGPLNLPLSMSRFFQLPDNCGFVAGAGCTKAPPIQPRPTEGLTIQQALQPNERVAVDGAFKTPGLRNVELTAPFFHNGGDRTLMNVVDFYNRGGNFPAINQNNFDPNIVILALTPAEKQALVALMVGMTDERVRFQRKPFDHPQLFVPNLPDGVLPAVGRYGSATPLRTFDENLVP
jgi:cytochrome c peroxidase